MLTRIFRGIVYWYCIFKWSASATNHQTADSFVVAMLDGGAIAAGAWSTREAQQGATVAVSIIDLVSYFINRFK